MDINFTNLTNNLSKLYKPCCSSVWYMIFFTQDVSGLSEAELQQDEVMTEDSLSNDEYDCTSPDDISLPPLAETPESNAVQSDVEESFCFSSHSTHVNQYQTLPEHSVTGALTVRQQTETCPTPPTCLHSRSDFRFITESHKTDTSVRLSKVNDYCIISPHMQPCFLQIRTYDWSNNMKIVISLVKDYVNKIWQKIWLFLSLDSFWFWFIGDILVWTQKALRSQYPALLMDSLIVGYDRKYCDIERLRVTACNRNLRHNFNSYSGSYFRIVYLLCLSQVQMWVQLIRPESADSSCFKSAHQHSVHHPQDWRD